MLIQVALLCIVAWVGDVQGECCLAKKYEVRAAGTFSSFMRKDEEIYMPRMSVDFDKKILSIDAELKGKYPHNSTMIFDYGTKFGYFISYEKKSCFRMPIPGDMDGPCIPKTAKKLGDLKIGYGKKAMACQSFAWTKKTEKPKTEEEITMLIQKDGCVPVTEVQKLKSRIFSMTQRVLYFDYSPKIKDASVFKVPSFCKSAGDLPDISKVSQTISNIVRKFTK